MRRAILSVSDKTGLVDFARGLAARGFELVSTGGTANAFDGCRPRRHQRVGCDRLSRDDGRPRQDPAPENPWRASSRAARMPRPRRRPRARHRPRRRRLREPVSVCGDRREAGVPFDAWLIEQIDIGILVRAAAKNFRDVLVVVSPTDYPVVLDALDREGGPAVAFRFELARRAFAHTGGAPDTAIASTLGEVRVERDLPDPAFAAPTRRPLRRGATTESCGEPRPELAPDRLAIDARKLRDLRYGENPHQPAAWYAIGPTGGPRIRRRPPGERAVVHDSSSSTPRRASSSSSTSRRHA